MIARQTLALLVDAYRELNAKKLFWITMALSGVLVVAFASLGIGERGITFFSWTLDFIPITSAQLKPDVFYKLMFSNIGISLWLTWAATILALISTAGMIPDLVTGGTIETVLSKPVSRVRLFLTKYFVGLLFVVLQVAVFSVGCFVVFGLRAGLWEPRLMLAVPIVVAFYSYLACFCALMGLLTRSTIAALLLTILFWFLLFVVNTTDGALVQFRVMSEMTVEQRRERIKLMERNTDTLATRQRESRGEPIEGWTPSEEDRAAANPFLARSREQLSESEESLKTLVFWSDLIYGIKTALPKTSETSALLERSLIDLSELPGMDGESDGISIDPDDEIEIDQGELNRTVQERLRDRPLWWVLGTSLGFEAVVLLLCCWIFARRDF